MNQIHKTTIAFLRTTQKIRGILHKQSTGISFTDMSVLIMISESSGVSVKNIAEFSKITNASASAFVAKMKELKFLTTRTNVHDMRALVVKITKLGKMEIVRKKEEALIITEPYFIKFTKDEQKTLFNLLEKLSIDDGIFSLIR